MAGHETFRTISIEPRGHPSAHARSAGRDAVNAELHAELTRIFTDVGHDTEADVVVLTGRGRAFCAGGDIDWMQAAIDDPGLFEETGRQAKEIVFGQLDLPYGGCSSAFPFRCRRPRLPQTSGSSRAHSKQFSSMMTWSPGNGANVLDRYLTAAEGPAEAR